MSRVEENASRKPPWETGFQELLEAGLPPRPFWQKFLQLAAQLMHADAGLLWEVQSDEDRLVPGGIWGAADLREPILRRNSAQISHVIQAAARDDLVAHATEASENESLPGRVILSVPYHTGQTIAGVLELILSKHDQGAAWRERVERLQTAIVQAEQQLEAFDTGFEEHQSEFWSGFEDFAYQLHRSLTLKNVIDVVVNDGRQILGCERLSLAVLRGKRVRVQGVSGSEQVNWRSQEVQSLQTLAQEAIAVRNVLEFRGDDREFSPRVGELFAHHVELTGARLIVAVPLYAPSTRKPDAEHDFNSEPDRGIVGCLLIEQFHESRLSVHTTPQIPMLADHIGAALANSIAHEQVFLLPTRRWLGQSLDFFRGRLLAKTLLVLGLLVTLVLCLIIVPWDYRVEAEGRLMPTTQRRLFAPWEGKVVDVLVDNGDRVTKEEILLVIQDLVLEQELSARIDELEELQQQRVAVDQSKLRANRIADKQSEREFRTELAEIVEKMEGLNHQIEIMRKRIDSLTIRAPVDGVVATFQVRDKLLGHPVNRGDRLLEVMDDSGDWRLELELPEHRMGHLLTAFQPAGTDSLPVEYVLATDVEQSFSGKLLKPGIATRSEVNQESGTVVQLFVETDKEQLPFLRIGADATGKIACGKRSLGYVLLGDVWEFVLRYVWL